MTTAAWGLLGLTLVFAVADWIAVGVRLKPLEYVCKPATMVALIAMVLCLHPEDPTVRTWFVVALVCSLAGDVFLMLPSDLFIAGLASFLVGHIAFVVGLAAAHESWPLTVVGVAVVVVALAVVAPRVVRGARAQEPALVPPVLVYMGAISLMVVSAWGSAVLLAVVGATFFYLSDAILAWNRFVKEHATGHLAVMVTYHLAQIGLALSLVR